MLVNLTLRRMSFCEYLGENIITSYKSYSKNALNIQIFSKKCTCNKKKDNKIHLIAISIFVVII